MPSGEHLAERPAAFSPDSRLLATCSRDSTIRLWQVPSGACRELPRHTDQVYAVAFHNMTFQGLQKFLSPHIPELYGSVGTRCQIFPLRAIW